MATRGRPKKSLDETLGLTSESQQPDETVVDKLSGRSIGIRMEDKKYFIDIFNYNIDGTHELVVSLDCGNSFNGTMNAFKVACMKYNILARR